MHQRPSGLARPWRSGRCRPPGRGQHAASRILFAALLLAGCLTAQGTDPAASLVTGPPAERIAFVTHVSGKVSAMRPGEHRVDVLSLFAALADGTVVKPGAGASVTVLCKSDTVLQLFETVGVTGELCARGAAVPPGTYARLDPRTGRLPSVPDPFDPDLRREKRDDYGRVPVVLSPRQTALMTNRPVLRWIEVPGAVDYRVRVLGPAGFEEILDAKQLICTPEEAFDRDRRACSCSWPADRPGLTNKPHSLEVGVRLSLVERDPRVADEILWIRRLSAEKEAEVNRWVERLQGLHRGKVLVAWVRDRTSDACRPRRCPPSP